MPRFDASDLRARLVASTKPRPRVRRPNTDRPAPGGKPVAAPTPLRDTPADAAEIAELRAERERLVEKFTVMEADLGGAFYEMAIRDHVRMDVLTRKAAELQRVDAQLMSVERALELERTGAAGMCSSCGAPYAHGTRFCGQCGAQVAAG